MCDGVVCTEILFQEAPSMKRLRELFERATVEWGTDYPGVCVCIMYVCVQSTSKYGYIGEQVILSI